jgi:putative methyltransferase (TIGR04325 family)
MFCFDNGRSLIMEKIKKIARLLSPPILWQLGSLFKSYLNSLHCGSGRSALCNPGFHGPFSTWEEAEALSNGWDSDIITKKKFQAAIKVRDGLSEFEQDSIMYDKIIYSETILAFLILHMSRHKNKISIIDFGGGLGTNYFQNRKILGGLYNTSVSWNIVELPLLSELGREHFANSQLTFFSDIGDAIRAVRDVADSVLFSGSLQYIPEPFALLDQVIDRGGKLLAFDRLVVSPTENHAVFVHVPHPEYYYPATYPSWCFSKELFIRNLAARGFQLVEHFTRHPDRHFDICGMIFKMDD